MESRQVAMPNEIFTEMKEWLQRGDIKSPQHQEFIYCFYWVIAYLWGYAKYADHGYTLGEIKKMLGYNPDEKRLNYVIKKNGLLDQKGYTSSVSDYPVLWHMNSNDKVMKHTMLSDYSPEERKMINKFNSARVLVKAPLLSIGDENREGLYWNTSNTHILDGTILLACVKNPKIGCAGFYLYGLLKMISDKNNYFENRAIFECANSTLENMTGWSTRKIIGLTNELHAAGLIKKIQTEKKKGKVNSFSLV